MSFPLFWFNHFQLDRIILPFIIFQHITKQYTDSKCALFILHALRFLYVLLFFFPSLFCRVKHTIEEPEWVYSSAYKLMQKIYLLENEANSQFLKVFLYFIFTHSAAINMYLYSLNLTETEMESYGEAKYKINTQSFFSFSVISCFFFLFLLHLLFLSIIARSCIAMQKQRNGRKK